MCYEQKDQLQHQSKSRHKTLWMLDERFYNVSQFNLDNTVPVTKNAYTVDFLNQGYILYQELLV